jgi:hypothetical protein
MRSSHVQGKDRKVAASGQAVLERAELIVERHESHHRYRSNNTGCGLWEKESVLVIQTSQGNEWTEGTEKRDKHVPRAYMASVHTLQRFPSVLTLQAIHIPSLL